MSVPPDGTVRGDTYVGRVINVIDEHIRLRFESFAADALNEFLDLRRLL